jgi:catechol 2,3-dioxygenase-like lactoylglutathione lyase family enzyme
MDLIESKDGLMRTTFLDHLVLNVMDVEASASWYEGVLGMNRETHDSPSGSHLSLLFGRQKINLRPINAGQTEWFTARQPIAGSADLCFLVDAKPADVVRHLAEVGVEVEQGPITKKGALGPICSVYCRDPDGSLIEISSYMHDFDSPA